MLKAVWDSIVRFVVLLKQTLSWITQAAFNPTEYLSKRGIDNRTKEEIVKDSGYPYELHSVTTGW